jgi:cbb3-type cytochrome oxidase subunit 3
LIDIYSIIVLFWGFLLALVVYYFLKVRNHSEFDYHTPMRLPQDIRVEKPEDARADINWIVSMETPDGTVELEARNISLGRAFSCCQKPLPIGEIFRPPMIGPNNEPVVATSKVVWSNVNLPDEKVINRGMGFRFIKMSDRHIRLVRQILQE